MPIERFSPLLVRTRNIPTVSHVLRCHEGSRFLNIPCSEVPRGERFSETSVARCPPRHSDARRSTQQLILAPRGIPSPI